MHENIKIHKITRTFLDALISNVAQSQAGTKGKY